MSFSNVTATSPFTESIHEAIAETAGGARCFFASVLCAQATDAVAAGERHLIAPSNRTLFCQCTTVKELLGVLENVVGPRCRAMDNGRLVFSQEQSGTFFLWVDMHGVPPPVDCGGEGGLSDLWRLLGLRQEQVTELSAIPDCFRSPEEAVNSQRSAGNEPYEPQQSADFPAIDLSDLYKEDLRASRPDSVVVHPLAQERSSEDVGGATAYCVTAELAVILQPMAAPSEPTPLKRISRGHDAQWSTDERQDPFSSDSGEGPDTSVLDGVTDFLPKASPPVVLFDRASSHIGGLRDVQAARDSVAPDTYDDCELESTASADNRRLTAYDDGWRSEGETLPLITSAYLVALPSVCVTWCPASSFGCAAAAQAAPVLTRSVKDWHRLQETVVARMRGSPYSGALSRVPTTAQFASLLLATACYAYLPDTTAVLSEVDAIDAMLPLIVPDRESDQADALRRVLVLRRRLAVHRRLLYQKMRLLEELQRPAMHTLAAFMNDAAADAKGSFKATREVLAGVLRTLDGARTTLGNTTLIYSSAVTSRNFKASNDTDFFQLALQYLCIAVLPVTIAASQWGMNCAVPWMNDPSLQPFFIIVGVLLAISIAGLAYPFYAMKSGQPELMA